MTIWKYKNEGTDSLVNVMSEREAYTNFMING